MGKCSCRHRGDDVDVGQYAARRRLAGSGGRPGALRRSSPRGRTPVAVEYEPVRHAQRDHDRFHGAVYLRPSRHCSTGRAVGQHPLELRHVRWLGQVVVEPSRARPLDIVGTGVPGECHQADRLQRRIRADGLGD
jgi:hypothetical protein